MALFLASSDSSFVNGVELLVDGGTPDLTRRFVLSECIDRTRPQEVLQASGNESFLLYFLIFSA